MSTASRIARILLGVLFVIAGLVPFIFPLPPPQPGMLGTLIHALFASHWMLFVGLAQLLIGISFLVNRFVPIALIMAAAFLYNSFAFHVTTAPALLPLPILASLLWLLIALPYRRLFAPIFAARPEPVRSEKSAIVRDAVA